MLTGGVWKNTQNATAREDFWTVDCILQQKASFTLVHVEFRVIFSCSRLFQGEIIDIFITLTLRHDREEEIKFQFKVSGSI